MVQRNILIGSIKAGIGMFFIISGLGLLRILFLVKWIWAITVPCVLIGIPLVLWGARDIKYGEEVAPGWNTDTILPSRPVNPVIDNNREQPPSYDQAQKF